MCGSVGVQYQAPHNVTFSARADTKNAKLASVEYKPDAVKGLKIKVKGKQAEQNAVLVGARYRRKYVAVDAEVDVLPQSNSVHQMKTSVAVGTRGFFIGALAQLHLTPASCEKGEQTEGAETTGKKLCCDYLAVCPAITYDQVNNYLGLPSWCSICWIRLSCAYWRVCLES